METRPITKEDWEKHRWIDACAGSNASIFIRGIKKTEPPDDGYVYVDVTTLADSEQKWRRAEEVVR